jgi:uncharacterized membrane protein
MFSFVFQNKLYLFGLFAALIPLIIHLSRSRRTKKMRFSTTRFFTEQFLRSYRMSRLKELLLLATRMALFALFAMALARPFVTTSGGNSALGATGSGPRTAILVLDNSASMGYTEDGVSLFKRAQDAASTVLRNLSSHDFASVVLAGRRDAGPEVLFPEPTDRLDEVRSAIDRARVSGLGTDLNAAVERAEELAVSSRAAGRGVTIYVFSDLQKSGWTSADDSTTRSDRSDAYVFVGVRPRKPVANRAVTAVRYAATRPRVGVPFPVRPLLSLAGDAGQDVNVRLYVDREKVAEQKVERLPGGRWAAPRFYHTFKGPGWHGGYVEVDEDNLSADNRRYFAIEVPESTETVPVLAVNGAPSDVPHQDELFFLRLALTAAPEGQRSPFQLTAIGPPAVAGTDLGKYPLVILANVERLTEGAVEKLEDYVAGGGKLLVFLGDKVNVAFYNDKLAGANRRNGGLLPARLKWPDPSKVGQPAPAGFISEMNYEHRALAAFQEPKLGTLLGPSLTFKALRAEAPAAAVLMKTSKGVPLLSEKTFGKGRVLLFTSTCDRDWTDFPVRPAFLLWSRFVAEYLTQAPLSLQAGYRTGDTVRLTAPSRDDKGPLYVKTPDGKRIAATRSADEEGIYTFVDTAQAGLYTVLKSDQETRLGLFAVNLENYESDLSYLDSGEGDSAERRAAVVDELKKRMGRPPLVSYVDDVKQLGGANGAGGAFKLWDAVLVVVLLIGLFEPWLANQISVRLYGKPRAAPSITAPGEARGARTPDLGAAEPQMAEGATR